MGNDKLYFFMPCARLFLIISCAQIDKYCMRGVGFLFLVYSHKILYEYLCYINI